MGWSAGAALRVCSRRAPPIPLPSRCKSDSAAFAMPLALRFAIRAFIRRGLCLLLVVVGGWGRCLSFGTLGLLLVGGCLSFLFWRFCPLRFPSRPVGGCGWFWSFDAGRCCWCCSFGALWLLPALGVFLVVVVSGVCCLVLWASWGFCPPWGVRPCGLCSVFVFWRSGASAHRGCLLVFVLVVLPLRFVSLPVGGCR